MREINARNVNDALFRGGQLLLGAGETQSSRAGEVIVLGEPVVTVTHRPCERVLFSSVRDANPFFHLFESIWMLAGRNDVKWLDQFVGDYSARFGESDDTQHDAYGHRWREHFGFDQLEEIIRRLQSDPLDRQCVIQMWDADDADDLSSLTWKTRPCNTHCYVRVRRQAPGLISTPRHVYVLDLTVLCRSNDAVWGAHGANAVHFSMLQEYLAGRIGVGVGTMYQWSNNYHVYTSVLSKLPRLSVDSPYEQERVSPLPIGDDWGHWDEDLCKFMESPFDSEYRNIWFSGVAVPMLWAHRVWREGSPESALKMLEECRATDWALAATEWIQRRVERREKK